MHTFIQDTNAVTSSTAEMWRVLQSSPISLFVTLKNAGANNIDYQFQESSDGVTFANIAATSGTLTPAGGSQIISYKISSSLAMVRLTASSSSGSTIDFAVSRYYTRAAYGPLPLLSL
jgi:hypothetical protein